jgi:hypothetical protein
MGTGELRINSCPIGEKNRFKHLRMNGEKNVGGLRLEVGGKKPETSSSLQPQTSNL